MGVEIAVPIAFFGSIIASIWLVSYFNSRKRLTIHETLRHAIDKGQTLSPELLQNMSLVTDPVRADLRRGVLFLAFGAAFGVLAALIGHEEADALTPMLGVATFPRFLLYRSGGGPEAFPRVATAEAFVAGLARMLEVPGAEALSPAKEFLEDGAGAADLAAWLFCGIALALTAPMWITVNVLGDPDNGVIVLSYIGSFILAGAFLSIGICMSALTRNQIVAFILGAVVCFLFTMSGLDLVLNAFRGWAPDVVVDTVASFSFLTRFEGITRGVLAVRDFVFFFSLMAFWLFAAIMAVDARKAA